MGQIQRIQSVYLFLASLFGGSLFGLPFATGPVEKEGMLMDGYLNINDNIGLIILTVAVVVLSLAAIFLYNNRVLQMNLGKLNLVLALALLVFAGYLFSTVQAIATVGGGLFMPILVMLFVVLANKNIQKDEKLVRDSNRLR
ncbi:DUF4293 domain-containing protein [Aureispira anguillae]|uniref:DUF4293 domain-containing protein n=1 Tax=Aureispira anguillae TaxID=2864201 RepID=A0A915YDC7_9BACT|nr:DUF4293 domain-containing protein [Aureispira anguillae]BDS10993.1 DUF4293 domain-containing protein [Aureispira anguillae]